ncbi:MAG TPA: hypothetical protein VFL78_00795 [Rhodanobacteraceae bacterium]|nr:hypothetical protein [Rhodanobacteraceae bacterium]
MADVHPFGHESASVRTGTILKVAATLFGTVVVVLVILYFAAMHGLLGHHAQVVRRVDTVPPPPRLQAHPDVDIAELRREKHEALSSYAWVGPAHRFARIPIKRAMQLYVQQHDGSRHAPAHKDKQR